MALTDSNVDTTMLVQPSGYGYGNGGGLGNAFGNGTPSSRGIPSISGNG